MLEPALPPRFYTTDSLPRLPRPFYTAPLFCSRSLYSVIEYLGSGGLRSGARSPSTPVPRRSRPSQKRVPSRSLFPFHRRPSSIRERSGARKYTIRATGCRQREGGYYLGAQGKQLGKQTWVSCSLVGPCLARREDSRIPLREVDHLVGESHVCVIARQVSALSRRREEERSPSIRRAQTYQCSRPCFDCRLGTRSATYAPRRILTRLSPRQLADDGRVDHLADHLDKRIRQDRILYAYARGRASVSLRAAFSMTRSSPGSFALTCVSLTVTWTPSEASRIAWSVSSCPAVYVCQLGGPTGTARQGKTHADDLADQPDDLSLTYTSAQTTQARVEKYVS